MPHPLYLEVMGITIHEYNSYSDAKKARFQKTAQEKLAKLHQTNPKGYTKLTEDAAKTAVAESEEAEADAAEDKENS